MILVKKKDLFQLNTFLPILLKSANNSRLTFTARKKLDTTTGTANLCSGHLSNCLLWQEVSEQRHTWMISL